MLRLGGNTSEFAYWQPTPHSPEPEHPKTREVVGEPKAELLRRPRRGRSQSGGFLKATGWTCLYGIGMGTNTPERAADEAEFVAKTLGSSLQYFQIGNEVDLFDRHLRDPKTWSAKTISMSGSRLPVPSARACRMRNSACRTWPPILHGYRDRRLWPSIQNPPHVTTLTHHHYFGGPATNPEVNIPNLLKPATMAKVQKTADIATDSARKVGARVRMTEGNTCYRGGKPGVSDVFAAALWAADYSLLLASNNYSGINLHGGTGKSVANSVGGTCPAMRCWRSKGDTASRSLRIRIRSTRPIATFGSEYMLEPVAYGLKFAGSLSGGTFLPANLTARYKRQE